jgi:galactose mutarotase-like enzyme
VVLGFATLVGYLNNTGSTKTYFGAIVGRYGNRIAKGAWLNGNEYHVPIKNNANSLHGGTAGFDTKVWQASQQNGSDRRPPLPLLDSRRKAKRGPPLAGSRAGGYAAGADSRPGERAIWRYGDRGSPG